MQSTRVYPPREEKTGTPAGALSGEIDKWTRANDMRTLMNMKNKAARERESYGKAAEYKKAEDLENLKAQHQKELAELKAKLTQKHGAKKKLKEPDMLEQFMFTKGHFPAAMKAKKTAKGTDNPFAEYTPEDEQKHIAALAQMRGFVPDGNPEETAPSHEGGIMGIGGRDIPAQVIQKYKPGPNAGGGSVEIAEPQEEAQPEEA